MSVRDFIFGPDAKAPAKKEGGRAEASRPIGDPMANVGQLWPSNNAKPRPSREIEEARIEQWLRDHIARSQMGMYAEVVTLTPVLARALLGRNFDNRPLSAVGLDRYKRDIANGDWALNGQPIIVAKDGALNDGQHRCAAVAEVGRPIQVIIAFGAERDTRLTLDQGVGRTTGHYLTMQGVPWANNVAAVASFVWQYRNLGYLSGNSRDRPTKAQCLEVTRHYKGIADSVKAVEAKGTGLLGGRSILAFCHFSFAAKTDETNATDFMRRLIKGENLAPRSPVLYARNRLMEGRRMRPNERAELIFRAWNAERRGQRVIAKIPVTGGKLPAIEA